MGQIWDFLNQIQYILDLAEPSAIFVPFGSYLTQFWSNLGISFSKSVSMKHGANTSDLQLRVMVSVSDEVVD